MVIEEIRKAITEDGNDVYFELGGKKCGIEPTLEDGIFTFEVWCGTNLKEYQDFDVMVHDPFFDGKSIIDLLDVVEIFFC